VWHVHKEGVYGIYTHMTAPIHPQEPLGILQKAPMCMCVYIYTIKHMYVYIYIEMYLYICI